MDSLIELYYGSEFEEFRFICEAVSYDLDKVTSYVLIEKDRAVSTDGARIHIAYLDHNYEPGLYEIILDNEERIILKRAETDKEFPDYRKQIPDYKNYYVVKENCDGRYLPSIITGLLGRHSILIDIDFLTNIDFLSILPEDTWKLYIPDSPEKTVHLVGGNKEVVICSIKNGLKEYEICSKEV